MLITIRSTPIAIMNAMREEVLPSLLSRGHFLTLANLFILQLLPPFQRAGNRVLFAGTTKVLCTKPSIFSILSHQRTTFSVQITPCAATVIVPFSSAIYHTATMYNPPRVLDSH